MHRSASASSIRGCIAWEVSVVGCWAGQDRRTRAVRAAVVDPGGEIRPAVAAAAGGPDRGVPRPCRRSAGPVAFGWPLPSPAPASPGRPGARRQAPRFFASQGRGRWPADTGPAGRCRCASSLVTAFCRCLTSTTTSRPSASRFRRSMRPVTAPPVPWPRRRAGSPRRRPRVPASVSTAGVLRQVREGGQHGAVAVNSLRANHSRAERQLRPDGVELCDQLLVAGTALGDQGMDERPAVERSSPAVRPPAFRQPAQRTAVLGSAGSTVRWRRCGRDPLHSGSAVLIAVADCHSGRSAPSHPGIGQPSQLRVRHRTGPHR